MSQTRKALELEHRYPLPEIRLRIRSTEMAALPRPDGSVVLATAATSNIDRYLVLLTLDGGVEVIPSADAGFLMQPSEEGRLLCAGWDLKRFDLDTREFEVLAKSPVAPEEIWGACVTDRCIVMGSSTPKGTVAVYDRREGRVVREWSPIDPRGFYTKSLVEAPDGRIVILSYAPASVISVLDLQTFEAQAMDVPALTDVTDLTGGQFVDDETLLVIADNRALLLHYPDFALMNRPPNPDGERMGLKTIRHGGRVIGWSDSRPHAFDPVARMWEPLTDGPIGMEIPGVRVDCCAFVGLDDGTLVGLTDVTNVFWRLAPGEREPQCRYADLKGRTDGAPLAIGAFDGRRVAYGSSHAMQRFWSVDLDTGKGRDLGRCAVSGQANCMAWDPESERLFMVGLDTVVRVYDPRQAVQFPSNPGVFAEIGHGLARSSHQLLRVGRSLWTSINRQGYAPGGAIVKIDLETAGVAPYGDLVPAEKPTQMVAADERTLYVGTTKHTLRETAVEQSEGAHLVVFDIAAGRVTRTVQPLGGVGTLTPLCLAPDGRLLFLDGPTLSAGRSIYAWEPNNNGIERIGAAPRGLREVIASPDTDTLWATAFGGVGPLVLGSPCRIDMGRGFSLGDNDWDQRMCKHLQWHDGALHCIQFTDLLRFSLAP